MSIYSVLSGLGLGTVSEELKIPFLMHCVVGTEFGTLDGSRDKLEGQAGAPLTSRRWWNRKPRILHLP